MRKPPAKKLLFTMSSLILTLAAFIVGGIAMSSSVHGVSANTLQSNAAQSGCDGKSPVCKGGGQTNQTKAVVIINSVEENSIQASYLEPLDRKGDSVTITTTSSTTYQPDPGVVAAGKTVFVFGILESDGSITAQGIGFYDPTLAYIGGVVAQIDGSTITTQAKGVTRTILLTNNTTFLYGAPKSKSTQPASRSDVKVGVIIEARGKLNSDGSLTAVEVLIEQP